VVPVRGTDEPPSAVNPRIALTARPRGGERNGAIPWTIPAPPLPTSTGLTKIFLTYTVSDEAVEAAAGTERMAPNPTTAHP
jgi:hypothetical protein